MIFLTDKLEFPDPLESHESGIVAIGGDLSVERLQLAYANGIFPWFSEGDPILWHSPSYRMVLFPDELKVSKSMRQVLRKRQFKVTYNQAFEAVINQCKLIDRSRQGEESTWITDEMKAAYIRLHQLGIAKSVEVWQDDQLVGGLYGVEVGQVFCGESMFSQISNASKVALISLVQNEDFNYQLIDCQVYNPHLESLGAREIEKKEFLTYLP